VWRYYQTKEKGPWKAIKESPGIINEAIGLGAKKLTILSTSENLKGVGTESEEELEKLKDDCKYKGPLYFDIDNKEDIAEAIRSAQSLVRRLIKDLGVAAPAVKVYCSGSKGMHVIVDPRTFSSGRATKHLPLIYKEMAKDLHVLGMDFQVYSQGLGVSWRLPNVKRDDGKYRVEVSHAELADLSVAQYALLVKEPRPLIEVVNGIDLSTNLLTLFDRGKKRVAKKPKIVAPLTDEQLEPISSSPPACVEMIADGKVKESSNYNELGMQLAIYGARVGLDKDAFAALASRTADGNTSSQYNSDRQRRDHLIGLYRYVATEPRYKFACAPMRSLCRGNPCGDCPIAQGTQENLEDILEIFIRDKGYAVGTRDNPRQISNFTIQGEEAEYELPNDGSDERRTAIRLVTKSHTEAVHRVTVTEEVWRSKSNFIGQMAGYSDLTFTGSDSDVQKLKALTMSREGEMDKIVRVHTAGILLENKFNKMVSTYIEAGQSVNHYKIGNTHRLVDVPEPLPTLLPIHDWNNLYIDNKEQLDQTLLDMLNSNSKEAVALMAGWFSACHLKAHIHNVFHQFPLLSIWGAAGSGKSESAALWLTLNGVSYHGAGGGSSFSVPGMTKYALLHQCSSTTTIPRLLDEYNPTKMDKYLYTYAGELMKSSWSGQSSARGTLSSGGNVQGRTGATTIQIEVSSPLVVMSEQAPGLPAFKQRSISVYLTRAHREGCTEPFHRAKQNSNTLLPLAEAMMKRALRTQLSEVRANVEGYQNGLSRKIDDRPRFSFAVLKYGLQFLEDTCRELGLKSADKVKELRMEIDANLEDQGKSLYMESMQSEIDRVLTDVVHMVDLTESNIERCIVQGVHYSLMGDVFRLAPSFHATYMRYNKKGGKIPDIDRYEQFGILVEQEPYYVANNVHDPLVGKCIEFSISAMEEKGIPVDALKR